MAARRPPERAVQEWMATGTCKRQGARPTYSTSAREVDIVAAGSGSMRHRHGIEFYGRLDADERERLRSSRVTASEALRYELEEPDEGLLSASARAPLETGEGDARDRGDRSRWPRWLGESCDSAVMIRRAAPGAIASGRGGASYFGTMVANCTRNERRGAAAAEVAAVSPSASTAWVRCRGERWWRLRR